MVYNVKMKTVLPVEEYFRLSLVLVLVQCKHLTENQVAADLGEDKYVQPRKALYLTIKIRRDLT